MRRRPAPPPRDPAGVGTLVASLLDLRRAPEDDGMSSGDSSPTRHAPRRPVDHRRSSYENVPPPSRPPSCPTTVRRSTPSPRPKHAPPLCAGIWAEEDDALPRRRPASRHASPHWTDDGEAAAWRRPASACGGRMFQQPVECCGPWGGTCSPCHWGPQTWGHFHHHQNEPSHDCGDRLQQRIWQLELEKEQLTLQVGVLTDQVDAQNEKMSELEISLSRNQDQLNASEALLNKEMGCRSSAEGVRLSLMGEISDLRLRLSAMEREKTDTQERNKQLENELLLTSACLAEKEADLAAYKSKLNGKITPTMDNNPELDKLKSILSSVMAANEEKEKKIQNLNASLLRYKKLHELVLSNYSLKNNGGLSKISSDIEDNFLSALDNLASLADINVQDVSEKPPLVPGKHLSLRYCSSSENMVPTPQKTPPSKRHYSTLPRPHQADPLLWQPPRPPTTGSQSTQDLRRNLVVASPKISSGASFGRGFFQLKVGKRSSSAPQLAPDQLKDVGRMPSPVPRLRKIFGRVKRSGSEGLTSAELKRGGIRSTAGPRLGWSPPFRTEKFRESFCKWDCETVCEWLVSIGLGKYVPECKKWGKGGDQLLKTTDFEKELGIRNPIHRKKLTLSLLGSKDSEGEPEGRLDHTWVVRWLDDIGLPQYKDAFFEGRVDGRMLHHLTLEDLSHLKVSNLLHHISIRTAIQVLRENNFHPHALHRRSMPGEQECVSLWTNHRVMEWMRSVDLSEYAPNLRGSGVHGGIMLYEPRFDADLLATLLNIPPGKTLLRRHLSTQFKQLIGPQGMQRKREAAHLPLSPTVKVKSPKRSPFSFVKRKNRTSEESYICPMNTSPQNRTEEEKFLMKEMVLKNEMDNGISTSNV